MARRRRRRRLALVLLNPGRTRRIRLGKRGAFTVEIDRKTKRILQALGGGEIPTYWIGLPWKRVRGLEGKLKQAGRAHRQCVRDYATCWEDRRDRRGRRRRCRATFDTKAEGFRALAEASGDDLLAAFAYLDEGSPVFQDLQHHQRRGRGRRAWQGWPDAIDSLVPSSRRWADFDAYRIRRMAELVDEELERNSSPHRPRLRLPDESQRLLDVDVKRGECDGGLDEQIAQALGLARDDLDDLVELDDVPF